MLRRLLVAALALFCVPARCWLAAPWRRAASLTAALVLQTTSATGAAAAISVTDDVVGEQIRTMAAILPGLGKPDVYYPPKYAGTWVVEQTVTGVVGDGGAQSRQEEPPLVTGLIGAYASQKSVPTYERVYSDYSGNVILDRGVSTTNQLNALADKSLASFSPSNPNTVDVTSLASGKHTTLRVTKRSVEDMSMVVNGQQLQDASATQGGISYSEFSRVSTDSGGPGSVPQDWALRLLARYKLTDDDTIQGLERLYLYNADDPDGKPVRVIKSKLTLHRKEVDQ